MFLLKINTDIRIYKILHNNSLSESFLNSNFMIEPNDSSSIDSNKLNQSSGQELLREDFIFDETHFEIDLFSSFAAF